MQISLRIHELDSTDQRKFVEDYVDHVVESIQGGCEICVGTNNGGCTLCVIAGPWKEQTESDVREESRMAIYSRTKPLGGNRLVLVFLYNHTIHHCDTSYTTKSFYIQIHDTLRINIQS